MEKSLHLLWQVPFGEFALKIDPLSLLFLTALVILVVCAGVYAIGYLRPYQGSKPLGLHIFFYFLLALSFTLIVTANNAILFLGAWEVMAIANYFLIIFHDEKASSCKAGFLYLIATHCGTFCLFLMFFLMFKISGTMNFDLMSKAVFPPAVAGLIFLLALFGFGVKAGFFPMHIWLPHAHPAAPAHISALMSGIAIKAGIYGIARVLVIMGVLPVWCGYLLLAIGIVSGIMGVLYALGQHELKKLLAYHSIENIGIIALGFGVGLLGRSYNMPFIAVLGFSGGLLHVLNHAIFKGLLFLGAGAVIQKTHTGEIDQLGGVAKIMPLTSVLFLIGALSICGLPFFNGFISEFIIYFGFFQGLLNLPMRGVVSCAAGILSLALMGALALACFAKVYGAVFSGTSRHPQGIGEERGKEASKFMLIPMFVLAGLCVWIGLAPKSVARLCFFGGGYLAHAQPSLINLERVFAPMYAIIGLAFVFFILVFALFYLRRFILGPLPMPVGEAWGCGFTQVSSRFQYTASSFARLIVEMMKGILLFKRRGGQVTGEFPGSAHMSSSVHDASEETFLRPLLGWLNNLSRAIDDKRIRYTQMYLMYIFLFLIFLLVWKLR